MTDVDDSTQQENALTGSLARAASDLDQVRSDGLKGAALAVGILYIVITINNWLQFPPDVRVIVLLYNVGLVVLGFGLYALCRRITLSSTGVHIAVAVLAFGVLGQILLTRLVEVTAWAMVAKRVLLSYDLEQHTLTHDLLAFARKQTLQRNNVAVADILGEVERMVRRVAETSIRLEVALAPDAGEVVADRHQIEQVLLNLAINACDAMENRGTLSIAVDAIEIVGPEAVRHRLHRARTSGSR